MTDPIQFPDSTARFGLPMLHVAQAQKELFVNEAMARTDALLHPVVEGETTTPPSAPQEGECWIVANNADGAFDGHDNELACQQQGQWIFLAPTQGLRVFDKASACDRRYRNGWSLQQPILKPTDGATIDTEARAAIDQILVSLRSSGVLPEV